MAKLNLKYAVWKEGKYYVSQCLNVDVSSFGKTQKEALKNLEEAKGFIFISQKGSHIKYRKTGNPTLTAISQIAKNFGYARTLSEIAFSKYTHTQYMVDYPSKLVPENGKGYQHINFNNNSGVSEMKISIYKSNSLPDKEAYRNQEPIGQVTFKDGEGSLYINKTGYCDGPGCGPAYIAYSLYDDQNRYIIEFFDQTEETETSRQVLKSFSLR